MTTNVKISCAWAWFHFFVQAPTVGSRFNSFSSSEKKNRASPFLPSSEWPMTADHDAWRSWTKAYKGGNSQTLISARHTQTSFFSIVNRHERKNTSSACIVSLARNEMIRIHVPRVSYKTINRLLYHQTHIVLPHALWHSQPYRLAAELLGHWTTTDCDEYMQHVFFVSYRISVSFFDFSFYPLFFVFRSVP